MLRAGVGAEQTVSIHLIPRFKALDGVIDENTLVKLCATVLCCRAAVWVTPESTLVQIAIVTFDLPHHVGMFSGIRLAKGISFEVRNLIETDQTKLTPKQHF